MVALGRAGRSVESLARAYEPFAATIHDWVKQAGADGGERDDRLTSAELEELRHLRREVKQLRQERDILSKGCQWLRHWFEKPLATLGLHKTT